MRIFIIAGEASGDLHAANLIRAIRRRHPQATFRFFGGDEMAKAADDSGTLLCHYRDMAYMGFIPVLLHLPTILGRMRRCRHEITQWRPHVLILVDYAGFNLSIATAVDRWRKRQQTDVPRIVYYIAPKLWAWKEYRMRDIRKHVDRLLTILPFEPGYFLSRHGYNADYVGNPTADEVSAFQLSYTEKRDAFCQRHHLDPERPIIALLAGSRRQEIRDNLPAMLCATDHESFAHCQRVIAAAPGIDPQSYDAYTQHHDRVCVVSGETYAILSHSIAALVTSGTATLETAMLRVPQVVCYKTPVPRLIRWAFRHILRVPYISLVNLIAQRTVVEELFADTFTVENIRRQLQCIMPSQPHRAQMLNDYDDVAQRLVPQDVDTTAAVHGTAAADNAARLILCDLPGHE